MQTKTIDITQEDLLPLIATYRRKIEKTSLTYKRYLYAKINWNVRLIGIKGARGVGKTTMLLQRIKSEYENLGRALYVSLDDLWFQRHSLIDLADYANSHGIRDLFVDEVHRYPQWSLALKNIYDNYPDLRIVYTGSSLLQIDDSVADLSRRQTLYTLSGLSFREYLAFEGIVQTDPVSIDELVSKHADIAMDIVSSCSPLEHFDRYLRSGYYPFYKDAGEDYLIRLKDVAELVIDLDLPSAERIEYGTLQKAKKMLATFAERVPCTPNISKLCAELGLTRDLCLQLLYALKRAKLLTLLSEKPSSYKQLSKPEKVLLDNTNLSYALGSNTDTSTSRETFFFNQVGEDNSVTLPKHGDALVDGRYLFEIGGKGKTFDQIRDIPDSYVVRDGIEYGHGNVIPLWMFGLLH